MNSKPDQYQTLIPQLEALLKGELDFTSNMANTAALLHEHFGFFWTGFYRVMTKNTLVLGPFQGPVPCTRIEYGKGVCGTAWKTGKAQVVPDVHQFPGHIACSAASKSEIVVPVFKNQDVVAVLDIDSDKFNTFDDDDARFLTRINSILSDASVV